MEDQYLQRSGSCGGPDRRRSRCGALIKHYRSIGQIVFVSLWLDHRCPLP
jgi:hypothetical protein